RHCEHDADVIAQALQRCDELGHVVRGASRIQRNRMESDEQVPWPEAKAKVALELRSRTPHDVADIVEAGAAEVEHIAGILAELQYAAAGLLVRDEVDMRHLRDRVTNRFVVRALGR